MSVLPDLEGIAVVLTLVQEKARGADTAYGCMYKLLIFTMDLIFALLDE